MLLTSSLGGKYDVIKPFYGIVPGQNSSFLIFCLIELKFGTGVISEALISNSRQKIRYKYILKEKNWIFLRKTENFAQALLDKSVVMPTPLVTVN